MKDLDEIFEYLPLKYKLPTDVEYFGFLIESVENNYERQNYHFAFLSLHMVYMGIVYNYIYAIFKTDLEQFENVLIGHHKILNIKDSSKIESWHLLSKINEATIFQFFRAVGIPNGTIGNLKKPVQQRNEFAHTNGVYLSNEDKFNERVENYLANLEEIQEFCSEEYKNLFFRFLKGFAVKISKDEGKLHLGDFMRDYGVSRRTIDRLAKIKKKDYPKNANIIFNCMLDR
ncbi:hypothetical protein [Candidatus Mycalebacterium sp.]